jgi:ATP adenylyltransferase
VSVPHFDQLWNGWRNEYVTGQADDGRVPAGAGSVFARILASGLPDDETHIVHRGPTCFAILNAFPYTAGHTMVLPYRQVGNLEDLTGEEAAELWATVTATVQAVKAAYHPEALNVGINLGRAAGGSISEHLHVHVVPRWVGDGNFMLTTALTRTIPETLDASAMKLRAAWPLA